jgi:very-short-patch-repair endonuclease
MVRVAGMAARQEGVICRWQLLECGMSASRISRWIDAKRLHRIHPGVYAVGHVALSDRGWLVAALLHAGRGAALSHGAGAWWMGLVQGRPARIDVCAPGRRRSTPGVRIHRTTSMDRRFHRGLPVIALPSLLLQVAATAPYSVTRRALSEADFQGLLDVGAIQAALGPGKEGSAVLRRALAIHLPQLARCQNDFEAEFLLVCERHGIELPEVNARVGRYRPDMLWRRQRVIAELDGRDAHTRPAQVARDHARDLDLRRLGLTVLRYTWAQVRYDADDVADDLRARLAAVGP